TTYAFSFLLRLLTKFILAASATELTALRTAGINFATLYLQTVGIIVVIGILIFAVSGFYSHGRYYRSKYKAILIINSNSLVWLLIAILAYLIPVLPTPPRSVFIFGWLSSSAFLLGARFWSRFWRQAIKLEARILRQAHDIEKPKHILIIGGAGFIGSVLVRMLLNSGYRVRVLDNFLYDQKSLDAVQDHPMLDIHTGDSREVSSVVQSMDGVDAVVHLGEIVGDPACAVNDDVTIQINIAATRMIAEAAKGYGIGRFIYASSCSVYGASDQVLNEDSKVEPLSLYAKAKVAAEESLNSLAGTDFHPVILRLSTVYGFSPRPRFDLVVNLLAAKGIQEGEITIIGGEQWRPFVHVKDVSRAIKMILESPLGDIAGNVYNVGANNLNYTICEVGKIIHPMIPGSRIVELDEDYDLRNYRVSFDKITADIGFECQHSLQYGIAEIQEAYANGQILDYRLREYSNYKVLLGENGRLLQRYNELFQLYPQPERVREEINA
ncbi:MAG: NAD-dependent epimerase/dehydratase family protein, partial [Fidelibacterota bacterium]